MTYRAGDLIDLVSPVFEVDSYQSKMGDDADIVVVSFTVNENQAAKDLVDFIEKGYEFVLDADSTPGEIDNGKYKVFVELERNKNVSKNVMEVLDGVSKIANLENFRFRYHKSFKSHFADEQTLGENIPVDPDLYRTRMAESKIDNYKDFFSKSFLELTEMHGDELFIKKAYADPVGFVVKDFGDDSVIYENIDNKINMNDYAEILFMTKYIGDYNITKYGRSILTLTNEGKTLVVERL
jgi:hypothetical protein